MRNDDEQTYEVSRSVPLEQIAGSGGGNAGALISPAPGLGLSAYQDPNVPVKPSIKRQRS